MVSKSRSHAVSSKKHVCKLVLVQNKNSTTNHIGDETDDVSEEEVYAKPVKDISMETYTLQKLVMLGDNSIIADTDFVKIGEFSYRQFEQQTIRKLDNAVKDTEISFNLVSSIAVISAKGVTIGNSMQITVLAGEKWRKELSDGCLRIGSKST